MPDGTTCRNLSGHLLSQMLPKLPDLRTANWDILINCFHEDFPFKLAMSLITCLRIRNSNLFNKFRINRYNHTDDIKVTERSFNLSEQISINHAQQTKLVDKKDENYDAIKKNVAHCTKYNDL